jgi:flavodoxin
VSTALVVYRSHTGVTRRYGQAIADHLYKRGIDAEVVSVGECDMSSLSRVDYLFMGCWTSGMFLVQQHPDGPWLSFVRAMPNVGTTSASGTTRPKVALFTTYKLRTGSQFPRMRAALHGRTPEPELELKSRNGSLSDRDRQAIDAFTAR